MRRIASRAVAEIDQFDREAGKDEDKECKQEGVQPTAEKGQSGWLQYQRSILGEKAPAFVWQTLFIIGVGFGTKPDNDCSENALPAFRTPDSVSRIRSH